MSIKKLYRAAFYFSHQGRDYSVEYFRYDGSPNFSQTIYSITDGKPLHREETEQKAPTAETALQALIKLIP